MYEGNDGLLYEGTKLGKPNYKKAKECYQRSKTPHAYMNLAILLESGKLGKPNYKEAARNYKLSNSPFALYRLGLLYELGKLGKPDHKEAARNYKLSNHPSALLQLGILYELGKLGKQNYKEAFQYYAQSGTPEAFANIMGLCFEDKFEKEECLSAYKNLLDFEHPYKNLMLIRLYKSKKFIDKIELIDPEIQIANLTNQLLNPRNVLQPSQQAFILGILESFKDNYDDALLHLSEALTLGEKHAEQYLNIVAELQETQQKIDSQKELPSQEVNENTGGTSEESFSEKEALLDSKERNENLKDISSQNNDNTSQKLSQRKKKTSEELKVKYQEKLARVKQKLGIMPLTPLNEIDQGGEIVFSFLNGDVEKAFKDQLVENEKMKMMINDISYKPWAIEGDGKPEVLKHQYKGCLSRRINGEDRLVYKPVGARQVLIVSCEGHYKK